MQLVLDTKGVELSKRNQSFYVTDGTEKRSINPKRLHAITITTHGNLSISAIRLAAEHSIPIYILGALGRVEGTFNAAQNGKNTELRRKQAAFRSTVNGFEWVKELIIFKAQQQISQINLWQNRYPSINEMADKSKENIERYCQHIKTLAFEQDQPALGTIMALEGNCSKQYWQVVRELLPTEWAAKIRTRQAATDPFNVALNYAYGMLYTHVETAAVTAGLDAAFGVMHADIFGKPTLAFDLIEPFRTWVDAWVIDLIKSGELTPQDFTAAPDTNTAASQLLFDKRAKGMFIQKFHGLMYQRRKLHGKVTSFKNHLYRFAGKLTMQITNTP